MAAIRTSARIRVEGCSNPTLGLLEEWALAPTRAIPTEDRDIAQGRVAEH